MDAARGFRYSEGVKHLLVLLWCLPFAGWVSAHEPVRVALYADRGAPDSSVEALEKVLDGESGFAVTRLKAAAICAGSLSAFDAVIVPGGSAHTVAETLGEGGLEKVRTFVTQGGGYVGFCSGAYLACSGFSWGLGILRASTVSPLWRRGRGAVEVGPAEGMEPWFEGLSGKASVHYANGPVLQPDSAKSLPPYEVLAWYWSELAENGTPVGVMTGSPAMVRSRFGRGAVFVSSPHPEKTPGLEAVVRRAVRETARQPLPRDAATLWGLLEGMEVERLWKAGVIVDWRTGFPTGRELKSGDRGNHTHCSQFVAAACERAGVYILRPPEHPAVLLANAQFEWLSDERGAAAGWSRLADAVAAQESASAGKLVVAVVRNPDSAKPGHIALVRPGAKSPKLLEEEGPDVMQAGSKNRNTTPLRKGFSNHLAYIETAGFFAHELP
jgi:glutamine amidotransferase-like uncharacterized protein